MKNNPIERVGPVEELIRQAAARSRRISEPSKLIIAQFKVDIKRWNPKLKEYYPKWDRHYDSEACLIDDLLTNGGRDLIHNASFMTGTQPAALTYYALTKNSSFSPAASDTTLSQEITSADGSQMARHQPTGSPGGITESFSHTTGQNTTVIVAAFVNNGGAAVSAYGYGNFNASSSGTLGFESGFTGVTLQVNDALKLTVTLTLG